MPKLTETNARKLPFSPDWTTKYWDSEIRGIALFVGKGTKTWYYQRDVAGRTKRILIGRYPMIGAAAARDTAQGVAL
ncbi:MAG: Arm DNA-binding domain-containing protein [Pseudomonadota bacterium]